MTLKTMTSMTNVSHHPDASTLMSFAAGSITEALAVVVASHVDQCAQCRRELTFMEMLGDTLVQSLPSSRLERSAPVMKLRRQEADTPARVEPALKSDLPPSLARLVRMNLDDIPWRRLGIGVWHHRLPTATGDLRLLKVAPGRQMPEHGHGGSELTLMLHGSYADETGTYRAGDLADLDEAVEHTPIANAETGCVCLIASEKPARFKRLIPRIVQPLTGM
jgi:putative transcriptional regulator